MSGLYSQNAPIITWGIMLLSCLILIALEVSGAIYTWVDLRSLAYATAALELLGALLRSYYLILYADSGSF